jgi:hypothetical protein
MAQRGRPRINEDTAIARLPPGTLDRIADALENDEKLAEFLRAAVERELKRRERMR